MLKLWDQAVINKNEAGNHTNKHIAGKNFLVAEWEKEIKNCNDYLLRSLNKNAGVSQIFGFRAPNNIYNQNTFIAEKNLGIWYDCSIEEGFQEDQDGTNFYWPYTLDNGSPGNEVMYLTGQAPLIGSFPGLWELPVYCLILPPYDPTGSYPTSEDLRDKMINYAGEQEQPVGVEKITGVDWSLWGDFGMTKQDFVSTLKYNLDLRLEGNRAPINMVLHSQFYTNDETQQALQEFVEYALSKQEVRIVSNKQLLDWVRDPVPLN